MEQQDLKMFEASVKLNGEYVWVRPLCDFFGIHAKHQYENIKSDKTFESILPVKSVGFFSKNDEKGVSEVGKNRPIDEENASSYGKNRPKLGYIDKKNQIFLSKLGFIIWVCSINENTIREELKDQFCRFKQNIHDYLFGAIAKFEQSTLLYNQQQELLKQRADINKQLRDISKKLTSNIHDVMMEQISKSQQTNLFDGEEEHF